MSTPAQFIHDLTRPQLEILLDQYLITYNDSESMDSLRKKAKDYVKEQNISVEMLPNVQNLEEEAQRVAQLKKRYLAPTGKPAQTQSPEVLELATFLKSLQATQSLMMSGFKELIEKKDVTSGTPAADIQKLVDAMTAKSNKDNEKFLSRCVGLAKKWNGNDTNQSEAWDFLEAFEEIKQRYQPSWTIVQAGLRDCLKGRAGEWFLANRATFKDFPQFKDEFFKVFLPFNHERRIQMEIRREKQKKFETMDDFYARLDNLNRKLKEKFPPSELLDIGLANADPRYTVQINLLSTEKQKNKEEILRVARIIEHAEEYETEFRKERPSRMKYHSAAAVEEQSCNCAIQAASTTGKTQSMVCHSSDKPGHHYKEL